MQHASNRGRHPGHGRFGSTGCMRRHAGQRCQCAEIGAFPGNPWGRTRMVVPYSGVLVPAATACAIGGRLAPTRRWSNHRQHRSACSGPWQRRGRCPKTKSHTLFAPCRQAPPATRQESRNWRSSVMQAAIESAAIRSDVLGENAWLARPRPMTRLAGGDFLPAAPDELPLRFLDTCS
jgi:hypothetical protein